MTGKRCRALPLAWPGAELIMYDKGQKRSYLNIHNIFDAFSFPVYICGGQYQDENMLVINIIGLALSCGNDIFINSLVP